MAANTQGLTTAEATTRLARLGPNSMLAPAGFAAFLGKVHAVIKPLLDPMALMLLGAAVVYGLLGEKTDAFIMLGALVPVITIDLLLHARSQRALAALAGTLAPSARVLRDGIEVSVPTAQLVPGDVLCIREGDVLHADGIFIQASNVSIDESGLTGEAEPISKRVVEGNTAEEAVNSSFFAGSTMLSGQALGEVLQTGSRTRFGNIAALINETAATSTPIQRRTAKLVKGLGMVALVVAAALVGIGLLRGHPLSRALLDGISLAIAAMPEEFPLVYTLFLAVAAVRLGRRGVIVRRLASVETLGSTTIICTDKTGTLTRGEFSLDVVSPMPGVAEADLLAAAILACEPTPQDLMERAIEAGATARGIEPNATRASLQLRIDYDFDAVGKHMSHVWTSTNGGGEQLVAKGAFEGVLEHCDLPQALRAQADAIMQGLAGQGLRLLAVARRRAESFSGQRETDERSLQLLGFVGFRDPVRAEVPAAIALCQKAGIKIKLITGDHALTAHAVADTAGIVHQHDGSDRPIILTGPELLALPKDVRDARIRQAAIFARIAPEQKFEIVRALKAQGEIVAMIGDGINDAPALRLADIGLAMGVRGTDVAKGVADVVLASDDFAAVAQTVQSGRELLENIQQAFLYLIAFHIPIVGLALLAPLSGMPLLLLPVHMVWLQLLVHPVSSLAFQGTRAAQVVMDQPPRRPGEGLLPRPAVLVSAVSGALLTGAVLLAYGLALHRGEDVARANGMLVLFSGYVLLVWFERSSLRGRPNKQGPKGTAFWLSLLATLVVFPLVMWLPSLRGLTHLAPITLGDWGTGVGLAVAALGWRLALWRTAYRQPTSGST